MKKFPRLFKDQAEVNFVVEKEPGMMTRKILNTIKLALAESIEQDDVESMSRQARALILAMADHIDALEKARTRENLIKKYGRVS